MLWSLMLVLEVADTLFWAKFLCGRQTRVQCVWMLRQRILAPWLALHLTRATVVVWWTSYRDRNKVNAEWGFRGKLREVNFTPSDGVSMQWKTLRPRFAAAPSFCPISSFLPSASALGWAPALCAQQGPVKSSRFPSAFCLALPKTGQVPFAHGFGDRNPGLEKICLRLSLLYACAIWLRALVDCLAVFLR